MGPDSDLFVAQPVTFETMRLARARARGTAEVTLLSAQYAEDRGAVPEDFTPTTDLERSVLDVGQFRRPRRLPLIADILARLAAGSDAAYLIYTNVDIALMPDFYCFLARTVAAGHDAFVVNRRTISKRFKRIDQIPRMYAETGARHPGYDCFVFRREILPELRLGTICIGANGVGRAFAANIACRAERFAVFADHHLTFHLGDDRPWLNPLWRDYTEHNIRELQRILLDLRSRGLCPSRFAREVLQQIEGSDPEPRPVRTRPEQTVCAEAPPSAPETQVSQDPVFVVGSPGAATALLGGLLASGGEIAAVPPTYGFTLVSEHVVADAAGRVDPGCLAAALARAEAVAGMVANAAELHLLRQRAERRELTEKDFFEWIVRRLLEGGSEPRGPARWVETTPTHYYALDRISELYPAARFVALLRHPVPAVRAVRAAAGERREAAGLAARRWSGMVEHAERFRSAHPDRLAFVRQEDLGSDGGASIGRLSRYLGVTPPRAFPGFPAGPRDSCRRLAPRPEDFIVQHEAGAGMRISGYPVLWPRLQAVFERLYATPLLAPAARLVRFQRRCTRN